MFIGHTANVTCLYHLSSGLLASGSEDKTAKIWDVEKEECLKTLSGHTGKIWAITETPEGHLVTAADDDTLRVWDIHTGTCLKIMEHYLGQEEKTQEYYNSRVAILSLTTSYLAAANRSYLTIWDMDMGNKIRTWMPTGSFTTHISHLSKFNESKIIFGETEGLPSLAPIYSRGGAYVINIETLIKGEPKYLEYQTGCYQLRGHISTSTPEKSYFFVSAISKISNEKIAVGYANGTVSIYDVISETLMYNLQEGMNSKILSFALLYKQFIMVFTEMNAKIWDIETGQFVSYASSFHELKGYDPFKNARAFQAIPNTDILLAGIGHTIQQIPVPPLLKNVQKNTNSEFQQKLSTLEKNIQGTSEHLEQYQKMTQDNIKTETDRIMQRIEDDKKDLMSHIQNSENNFTKHIASMNEYINQVDSQFLQYIPIIEKLSSEEKQEEINYLKRSITIQRDQNEKFQDQIKMQLNAFETQIQNQYQIYNYIQTLQNDFQTKLHKSTEDLLKSEIEQLRNECLDLLDSTIEDFERYKKVERISLDQKIHAISQQFLLLQNEKKQIEMKIVELEHQLNSNYNTTSEQNSNILNEINLLKLRLEQMNDYLDLLYQDYELKSKRKEAILKYQNNTNLWLYYHIIQIKLEDLFLSIKSAAGGFTEVSSGNLCKAKEGFELLGDFIDIVPLIGNIGEKFIKLTINKTLEKVDETKQTNIVKGISALFTLSELKKLAESVARQLTEWYTPQLLRLPDEMPANNQESLGKKIKSTSKHLKSKLTKSQTLPQAAKMAEYGIAWILERLPKLIDKSQNTLLDTELVKIVTTRKSKSKKGKLLDKLAKFGKTTLITKENDTWHLEEIYTRSGIQTVEGELYGVGNDGTDTVLYGYCKGTLTAAKARGLNQVLTNASSNRKTDSNTYTNPQTRNSFSPNAKKPTEIINIIATLQEQNKNLLKKNDEHKKEIQELKLRSESQNQEIIKLQEANNNFTTIIETLQNQMQHLTQSESSAYNPTFWHRNFFRNYYQTTRNESMESQDEKQKHSNPNPNQQLD